MDSTDSLPVTLANCEDEPIHLPGAIQPHGALLALDLDGRVLARSANLQELTGLAPVSGTVLDETQLGGAVMSLVQEAQSTSAPWTNSVEAWLGEHLCDVIAHIHNDVLYLEFEPRTAGSASFSQFALYAQRIISQMQMRSDLHTLLQRVTAEIRQLTGYDRVMAYRFRPDLSGEVVAEAHRADLVSYLGQRYPASDIPAQARRLYIQNPIRLIADASYQPSRLEPALDPRTGAPFDLSFSTLRSVSPIHCEYLHNMGVKGSMSVSIVVGGKLWGLFSCHHMSAKTVPHPIRMSFQVISQVCSALVERLEHGQVRELMHQATSKQVELLRQAHDSEDLLAALGTGPVRICDMLTCDAAAIGLSGRVLGIGGPVEALAREVLEHLQTHDELDLFQTEQWLHATPEAEHARYCGVLAIRFYRQESGWLLWFRQEQVRNIKWAGKPEKTLSVGPSGHRLTPRGSFEAWEEIVRGRSAPWLETDLAIADKLRSELVGLCLARASEIDDMRQRLIAMLGHDLRNPLQSISMAAALLKSSEKRDTELRKHISHSSGRMERLITQIMEMSRLQSGSSIIVHPELTDLTALVQSIVDETLVAYPGLILETALEPGLHALADPDRFAQVVSNLLSNARHHGAIGRPVLVILGRNGDRVRLSILNEAEPLSEERLEQLFAPFKQSSGDRRNKTGLGIGLYISQAIATAHGSQLRVSQDEGVITFTLELPSAD